MNVFKDLSKALNYLESSPNKQLLGLALQLYGSEAQDFVNFAKNNGYDGLGFLRDLLELKEHYKEVLPSYSVNSTLVKTAYDQFKIDDRVSLDRNFLFLKALKKYEDLNLLDKNLYLQTIQALNNVTIAKKQLGLPGFDKNTYWLLKLHFISRLTIVARRLSKYDLGKGFQRTFLSGSFRNFREAYKPSKEGNKILGDNYFKYERYFFCTSLPPP